MRILQVNKFLYRRGGAEAYLLDVTERLRAEGHEVELWGMDHPDNPPLPLADTFPSYIELNPPPGGALGRARVAGRMVWSTSAARGIAAAVERFRPDVVHAHNIYQQLSPSIVRALARRDVPVVMTLHDYKLVCPTYQLLDGGELCDACVGSGFRHAVIRRCNQGSLAGSLLNATESRLHRTLRAYGGVDRFLCPSRFLLDTLRRGGVFPERLHLRNNFVDVEGVEPRRGAGDGFVFVGRLSHEKGIDTLIRAAALLPGDRNAVTVVGDGPDAAALRALADDVAPGRVTFTGRLDRDGVLRALTGSRAAVLVARWHENQPISILEAGGMAVPMVTSDLGGLPELVVDGETGSVVPHDDPAALAAALRTLHDEPERSIALGQAARRRVLAEFSPVDHLRALVEHYEAVSRTEGAGPQTL